MIQSELLGYRSCERSYPHAPGCTRLDVVLRDTPSAMHFDPEKVQLTTANPAGDIQHALITSGSFTTSEPIRVCAGRVVLVDRVEKRVQFLTLGGWLAVTREDGLSLCRLTSSAPIIPLALSREPQEILAEEIEELLARRRAFWETHHREFDRRLAAADPAALYTACLWALARKFQAFHQAPDSDGDRLLHFIDGELATLFGGGASRAAALEELL